MHPRNICKDLESMGSKLIVDGQELYIENDMNVYPELEQLIKSYKSRIVTYLKGGYSDKDHAVKQTIEKVMSYMSGVDQDMNAKIEDWLNTDVEAITAVIQLIIDLHKNGWSDHKEPFANYETVETDKLSKEIYERAMHYFKKGVPA